MKPQSKRWIVAPKVSTSHLARLSHVSPLIVQILSNRGVTDPAMVDAFLNGEARTDNPCLFRGMNEAVEHRLEKYWASLRRKDELGRMRSVRQIRVGNVILAKLDRSQKSYMRLYQVVQSKVNALWETNGSLWHLFGVGEYV